MTHQSDIRAGKQRGLERLHTGFSTHVDKSFRLCIPMGYSGYSPRNTASRFRSSIGGAVLHDARLGVREGPLRLQVGYCLCGVWHLRRANSAGNSSPRPPPVSWVARIGVRPSAGATMSLMRSATRSAVGQPCTAGGSSKASSGVQGWKVFMPALSRTAVTRSAPRGASGAVFLRQAPGRHYL